MHTHASIRNLLEKQKPLQELKTDRGVWVAQLVEGLTLYFGSGHHLRVLELSPTLGATYQERVSLSPSFLVPPASAHLHRCARSLK